MKRSVIAFVVALAFGFLGMGVLGALLYWCASPILVPLYGDLQQWHGDWVWPAMLWAGMIWPFAFLAAGLLDSRLKVARLSAFVRRSAYLGVLWVSAVLAWVLVLSGPFRTA